jgi:hypothetical protein
MIKSTFNKNKIPFVLYTVAFFLLALAFVLSTIFIENRYSILNLVNFSSYHVALLFASASFLAILFVDNSKVKHVLKMIAYATLIIFLIREVFYYLFFSIAIEEFVYFNFLISLFFLMACIVLLYNYLKKSSFKLQLIATAFSLLVLLIFFILAIIELVDYYDVTFNVIYSYILILFIIPLLFVGDLMYTKKCLDTELVDKLTALEFKYEAGLITKDQYISEKVKLFN